MFLVIIAIFGGVVYMTQSSNPTEAPMTIPSLPPEAQVFRQISPSQQQQQGQPQQETQNKQQVQGATAPTYGVEEGLEASYSAVIKTSKGNITVSLYSQETPNTVKNFLNNIEKKFYTGLTFHRVEDWVVQGGDPKGNGTGGGLIQTELSNRPFVVGSLGVARGGDIRVSNDSQFFITTKEATWLNGQYTNFGEVTEGMDVVMKIQKGDKILGITLQESK